MNKLNVLYYLKKPFEGRKKMEDKREKRCVLCDVFLLQAQHIVIQPSKLPLPSHFSPF